MIYKTRAKKLLKDFFALWNIALLKSSTVDEFNRAIDELSQFRRKGEDLDLFAALPHEQFPALMKCLPNSKSQLRQDLFVLSETGFKRNGYFVEFGATNGVDLSNTFLLEKYFDWNGILAEPARCWHSDLRKNRGCHIETDCVWDNSNSSLSFNEVDFAEFSTINSYSSTDCHSAARKNGKIYDVKTISLVDLLDKYNAPKKIDFLSIDTEGSEFKILESFDFSKYQFKIIVCEHNFTPAREDIFSLLKKKGYVRKFEELSHFDDWYVRSE